MAIYEIQKGVPVQRPKRTGLTETLRRMEYEDSITVPLIQAFSVHPCAAAAGIKVTTHRNGDGTVTVWRIDPPAADKGSAAPEPKSGIFG